MLLTPRYSGTPVGTIPESQAGFSESIWQKMIGKPYTGKPYVRFDEAGDGKVLWRT